MPRTTEEEIKDEIELTRNSLLVFFVALSQSVRELDAISPKPQVPQGFLGRFRHLLTQLATKQVEKPFSQRDKDSLLTLYEFFSQTLGTPPPKPILPPEGSVQ